MPLSRQCEYAYDIGALGMRALCKNILIAGGGVAAGALLMILIDHRPWLLESIKYNLSWDLGWNWLSALCNVVVAVTAAFGVPILVKQFRQAQIQTRMALGDEDPYFTAVEHLKKPGIVVVELQNLNRRAIFVMKAEILGADGEDRTIDILTDEGPEDRNGSAIFEPAITVRGWENRSERPTFFKLDLFKEKLKEGSQDGWIAGELIKQIPKGAHVRLTYEMIGKDGLVHKTEKIRRVNN